MAPDPELRAHQEWLGLIQPVGLVVSPPALAAAQAYVNRNVFREQETLDTLVGKPRLLSALRPFLETLLGWHPDNLVEPPETLAAPLPEYHETLRPTLAVADPEQPGQWLLLIQALPAGTELDELPPDDAPQSGTWRASPQVRFERLLRDTKQPIGLLTNQESLRLVYAPTGETSGHLTFPIAEMCQVAGRPMLGALLMLLGADRLFNVPADQRLPAILRESRKYQNEVSTALAEQVLTALQALVRGFQAADEAASGSLLGPLIRDNPTDIYGGLLATILRLVFILYAEDRGLMPAGPVYARSYSLLQLFQQLRDDAAQHPDTMDQRYGAWSRLLTLFRFIFDGASHADLRLPARRGKLFNPDSYPFLEGRQPGTLRVLGDRIHVPRVSDGTVLRVFENLLMLGGERLSYRALDVEQIGSVYEAMMGFELEAAKGHSIAVRPHHVVVDLDELLAKPGAARVKALDDEAGCKLSPVAAKAIQSAKDLDELEAALDRKISPQTPRRLAPGSLFLQPGQERRRSQSHYTPRSLTEPIVRKTLTPILEALSSFRSSERPGALATTSSPSSAGGGQGGGSPIDSTGPTPDQILSLKICDPAMGSGAFLVEACRFLGDALKDAWARHKSAPPIPPDEDLVLHARRLIAQRCLYGVDKNPFAVDLAKLSLWLVTLAREHPFTFLDHALRVGDSLVGLTREQIACFDWKPEKDQLPLVRKVMDGALKVAEARRAELHALGDDDDTGQKERLHREAQEAILLVRGIGDAVCALFLDNDSDKSRKITRAKWVTTIENWVRDGKPPAEIADAIRVMRQGQRLPPFHWELEFPEVFSRTNAGFDAFVGNPPFAGGKTISGDLGDGYADWLDIEDRAGRNGDLSARFFRRAYRLGRKGSAMGLIATNTIAQGDTREAGLQPIVAEGGIIFDATRSLPWPGSAAVAVAVVHVSKYGAPRHRTLDDVSVDTINSRLRAKPERADPVALSANAKLGFVGCYVLGAGFTVTLDDREALVKRATRNALRLVPYLGGEEINTSPMQAFDRYVINFGNMALMEAEKWPDLIEILRTKVKPERDKLRNTPDGRKLKDAWWLFGRTRPELYGALAGLTRCLVISNVTKHCCFAFQPIDRVWTHNVAVFAIDDSARFGVLQSRVHEQWARLLSATLEERLNYRTSDCFENFPFPPAEVFGTAGSLESLGAELYDTRANLMIARNQGLTTTYNQLKDPEFHDPEIDRLRDLHLELDRVVCAAYGWPDIRIPAYTTPRNDAEKKAFEAFEDQVIDRLFALNAERAEEERLDGLAAEPTRKPSAKRPRRKPVDSQGELSLLEKPETK